MDARVMFRSLLSSIWLRPESAMWYAYMLTLAEEYLEPLESPSLDFGCMDGVNSFILLGGKFEEEFDVYSEVEWDKDSHKRSTLNNDYFDTFNETASVLIETMPQKRFSMGIDWKDSHISKCIRLGLYDQLQKIDLDNPQFNAAEGHFSSIWAPNIYWMKNIEPIISELARVLHKDGKMVTIGPGPMQIDYMFYKYANPGNEEWLRNLDRGRYENAKATGKSLEDWKLLFEAHDLYIDRYEAFIPELVAKAYDVGFRPMFPVFMNIYETFKNRAPEDLKDLKKQWIETVYELVSPLCVSDWMDTKYPHAENAWFIFELRKK